MEPSRPDFLLILNTLPANDVEFIILGGVRGMGGFPLAGIIVEGHSDRFA
jgi:hypothetical protein